MSAKRDHKKRQVSSTRAPQNKSKPDPHVQTLEELSNFSPSEIAEMLTEYENGRFIDFVPVFLLIHEACDIVSERKEVYEQIYMDLVRKLGFDDHITSSECDISDDELALLQELADEENKKENGWPQMIPVWDKANDILRRIYDASKQMPMLISKNRLDPVSSMTICLCLRNAEQTILREVFPH